MLTVRRIIPLVVVIVVGVLLLMSVRTTGAYWADAATSAPGAVTAGRLSLSTGAGTDPDYTLPALSGTDVVPDVPVQAPLVITNTGDVALRYRLVSAGPVPSTASTVAVTLAGSVGGTCTAGAPLGPVAAFGTLTGVTATTAVTSTFRELQPAASETWCIRTTLVSVAGVQPASYTHRLSFRAEQT